MLRLTTTFSRGVVAAGATFSAHSYNARSMCCGPDADHDHATPAWAAPAPAPAARPGDSPFAAAFGGTLRALEDIAPIALAEGWDNVGMLIDRLPRDEDASKKLVVFITNGKAFPPMKPPLLCSSNKISRVRCVDLTEKTLKEAIAANASLIITYHPRPFGKQKKFGTSDPTSRIILECAGRGIAVYSPHTALDKVNGGMNDWLCAGLGDGTVTAVSPEKGVVSEGPVGAGRILSLESGVTLGEMVARVKVGAVAALADAVTAAVGTSRVCMPSTLRVCLPSTLRVCMPSTSRVCMPSISCALHFTPPANLHFSSLLLLPPPSSSPPFLLLLLLLLLPPPPSSSYRITSSSTTCS
jgi:putative NIF3 family GTP cyclohydrolase 1 type 2